MTRTCCDCGQDKPLSEYYACKKCRCKLCEANRVRRHRAANAERFRDYDKQRRNKETMSSEAWLVHIAERHEYTVRYRETNPKKYRAHCVVGRAIKTGKLVTEPCEVCGSENVHGHHDDYDKPLTVRWLCAEHHVAWHLEHGEGLNAD